MNANTMNAAQATMLAKMAGEEPPRFDRVTGQEEAKTRVRIRCRPQTQVLPGGLVVYRNPAEGERDNFAEIYVSQFDELTDLVEDATEEQFEAARAEQSRREKAWSENRANKGKPMAVCPHSFEEAFRWVMGRDMKPLEVCEDLGRAEPPKTKARARSGS